MSLQGGDSLAKGAKSHTFPSSSHVSQEKWDSIFGPRTEEPLVCTVSSYRTRRALDLPIKKKKRVGKTK